MFRVRFTADVVTEESAALGDVDRRGWVDPKWSMREVFDGREDVRSEVFDTEAEALKYIADTIGAYDDNGDGTYYSQDASQDWKTGEYWSYAAHIEEF